MTAISRPRWQRSASGWGSSSKPRGRRRGHARGQARPDLAPGRDGHGGYRRRQADAAGHHLLDRLDDQAHHGTAILMLQEEGKLSVDDPVEKHLPEFKDLKTAERQAGQAHDSSSADAYIRHGRGIAGKGPSHDGPGRTHT